MLRSKAMFENATILVIAAVGALVAGITALRYPRLCLGVLFLIASFSRDTLETPLGTMRPEMPAVLAIAAALLVGGRFNRLRGLPRPTLAMCVAFAIYVGVIAISSAFVAPGRSQSLHMVGWLAMSMLAGIEAFVLIQPRPEDAMRPLAFGGFAMGAIGILVAVAFLVFGPVSNFGVQDAFEALPRVFGVAWEANLYASFLAICSFFALEAAGGRRATAGFLMLGAILIGFPLGVTRAAYMGLAAGAVAYVGVRVVLEKRPRVLLRIGVFSAILLAVGVGASLVLLPNVVQRHYIPPVAVGSPSPGGTSTPGGPSGAKPGALPTFGPSTDTLGYRLERVDVALGEMPDSPLIGFGAVAFGQKNPTRYNGSGPDYIAVMSIAVLYESGIVGAAALAIAFALLLASLWIAGRRFAAQRNSAGVAAASAFIAAIICMLVSYQATNALPYAITWIILGSASALAASNTSGTTWRDLFTLSGHQGGQGTESSVSEAL